MAKRKINKRKLTQKWDKFSFRCRTCKKALAPKRGVLECCGFSETVEEVLHVTRENKQDISRMIRTTIGNIIDGEDKIEFMESEENEQY